MIDVARLPASINLGRKGEKAFRKIQFNIASWLTEVPDGKVSIIYNRPDGEKYAVIANITESPLEWSVSETDTAVSGCGKAEIRITSDTVIGKSATVETYVDDSLDSGTTPDLPQSDWITSLLTAAGNTANNVTAAQTAQQAAETAQAGAETARTGAESAKSAAETALSGAVDAKTAALAAATAAGTSASTADAAKTAALNAQEAAESAASNSSASATAAENSATTAAQSASDATTAKTAAETAQGKAETAQQAAESAQSGAVSAKTAAETAKTGAETARTGAETAQAGAETAEINAKLAAAESVNSAMIAILPSVLNQSNIKPLMKAWMNANGVNTYADLTPLLNQFYALLKTGWTGGVLFADPATSTLSAGTRLGDAAGKTCAPSTDATKGQDDFEKIPLFCIIDCNWQYDSDGELQVTEIDGVTDGFARYTPGKHVGVMQMAGYEKVTVNGSITIMYSDTRGDGYIPLPEAVCMDGTVRNFVVHSKYMMGDDLGCYSGVAPRDLGVSQATCITLLHNKWGTHYGAGTSADDAFLKLMWFIKYATMTMDGILDGCCSYDKQFTAALAETGVERVLLTTANGANFKAGSTVIVGVAGSGSNKDRSVASMRSIVNRKKIRSIESVTIDGTTYSAINIDNGGTTFDTTTEMYISTMPWYTGSCDGVLGNDGAPVLCTGGIYPCRVQGIEIRSGQYEVRGDAILQGYSDESSNLLLKAYVCRDASLYATSSTGNYRGASYSMPRSTTAGWVYVITLGYDPAVPELWFPATVGGSSSTYTRDAVYQESTTDTFLREWLAFGYLYYGVTFAGLSFVAASYVLSYGYWTIGARLGSTGNRGELAA